MNPGLISTNEYTLKSKLIAVGDACALLRFGESDFVKLTDQPSGAVP
jgi:hypothetical protein